jgi:hypothetical protein
MYYKVPAYLCIAFGLIIYKLMNPTLVHHTLVQIEGHLNFISIFKNKVKFLIS